MSPPRLASLLDPPAYPAEGYAPLADRLKGLLATRSDVVFVQAEAIVALEAAATSLARPGMTAVNIVTSPYGAWFDAWLRRGGAAVRDVAADPGQPIGLDAVKEACARLPAIDLVAVVHAESANGALNPLAGIAALARSRDALLVVDAVASFGGHPLDVDALGIDVAVIGPQKALGGSSGVSVAAVSARAWAHMAKVPRQAPSTLALLDLKQGWLDRGRQRLPGMPSPLEFWSLEAAVDRVEAEGLARCIARHGRAAAASRAGLRALGVTPWVADDAAASALVTAAPVPEGLRAAALIAEAAAFGATLGPGFGDIADRLVRLDHTGTRASFANVLANVVGYGAAIARLGGRADPGAAAAAVVAAYSGESV
jgi:aspartate aminotransferase-like enzyme